LANWTEAFPMAASVHQSVELRHHGAVRENNRPVRMHVRAVGG